MTNKNRCRWVTTDQIYIDYHDQEWGVPVFNEHLLFEFLILEGAQAGLSWLTVLKKREHYRKCFKQFDPAKVAKLTDAQIEKLLLDPGIIRNRLKVESTRINAKAFLAVQKEFGSFANYLWNFVQGKPIQNSLLRHKDLPTRTDISDQLSKDLKKRGFKFIGTTICYAFMQAIGMVNDHTVDCFRHEACRKKAKR